MIIVKPEGAPACCRSEREFMRAIHDSPGVYLANANVPNSPARGAFTREVDGVMLAPDGIYTVEVKGIRASGELHTPRMDAWTVVDGETRVPLMGRPHAQALTHSKFLASFLKDIGVAPGWIRAVLAVVPTGGTITLPEDAEVLVTENVFVVVSRPGVAEVLRSAEGLVSQRELSVEMVQQILTAFECVETAPSAEALVAEGFRTEADISAEVEERRQQVRDEFLAASTTPVAATDTSAGAGAAGGVLVEVAVADAPSVTQWEITAERYAAALALDPDLVETGAVVDGVAMHRRLVSYAARKGVALEEVAAVVNAPVEVLGDETHANLIYCGEAFAVSVRAVDGLAMFYKSLTLAKAERQGAMVDGREVTARAARQAIALGIPLEALVRMVTVPEERWWMPGTTDIVHARGEFAAVTSGHLGPVQYVMTRALAVQRALPKPTEGKVEARAEDVLVEGMTLRASAVSWCQRRGVGVETIVDAAVRPVTTWPGHSPNMEVRVGVSNAVLVDVVEQAVVAVMTAAEAAEYRDGIVKDGVRLSGRCVFLSKRRKVSVDAITEAFREPVTIARVPGVDQSVYIGSELAVSVDDADGAVVDFTFAGHALSKIRRQELVPVDLGAPTGSGLPVPAGSLVAPVRHMVAGRSPIGPPSPAMLAKSGRPAGLPAGLPVGESAARVASAVPVGVAELRPSSGPSPLMVARRQRSA